jgi:hypothetical protein
MRNFNSQLIAFILLLIPLHFSSANPADVIDVKATQSKDKSWRFDVTIKHDDKGWDHYVNQWIVVAPDNKILATRTLYHPHIHEQPFTRNIQGVSIPKTVTKVRIIARDSVHQRTGKIIKYDLKELKIIEPEKQEKNEKEEPKKENKTP